MAVHFKSVIVSVHWTKSFATNSLAEMELAIFFLAAKAGRRRVLGGDLLLALKAKIW